MPDARRYEYPHTPRPSFQRDPTGPPEPSPRPPHPTPDGPAAQRPLRHSRTRYRSRHARAFGIHRLTSSAEESHHSHTKATQVRVEARRWPLVLPVRRAARHEVHRILSASWEASTHTPVPPRRYGRSVPAGRAHDAGIVRPTAAGQRPEPAGPSRVHFEAWKHPPLRQGGHRAPQAGRRRMSVWLC